MLNPENLPRPQDIEIHDNDSLDQVPISLIDTGDNGFGLEINSAAERGERNTTLGQPTEYSTRPTMPYMNEPANLSRCSKRRGHVSRIGARFKEKYITFATRTATSDTNISFMGLQIMESTETLKLFKFLFVTLTVILAMHQIIRKIGWENDYRYKIEDFIYYDLNHVILDSFVFFLVGRLYKRPGVDRLVCITPMVRI